MLYFYDKSKGYSIAVPSSFISFEAQPAGVVGMALALAGLTELPAPQLIKRCSRVLMVPHPKTKSPFTRSKLKDNLRRLVKFCDELGDSGVIAWE